MPTHHQGPPSEVRALDAFIKLMRATDSLAADLARQLDALGMTLGQLAILEALLHLGAMSQQRLAGKIMRSGSHVTTVLDHLERDGLVSPHAAGRRPARRGRGAHAEGAPPHRAGVPEARAAHRRALRRAVAGRAAGARPAVQEARNGKRGVT